MDIDSFFMQDCSKGDLVQPFQIMGPQNLILLEKPIACQSVVFSSTKDPQLQFLTTGLLCIMFMFYNYTSFWQ